MKRSAWLLAAALLIAGGALLLYSRRTVAAVDARASTADVVGAALEDAMNAIAGWTPPERAAPYLEAIAAAELAHGLPQNLLARLLYQESRYRPDVISGETKSPAGALGIAQFMPATAAELGVDPLDPLQAIDGAARYLKQLHASLGDWAQALAAYNWGIGNVRRKGLGAAPKETRDYVAQISADVGLA